MADRTRSELGAAMARLRWEGTTAAERKAMVGPIAASGGRASWEGVSAEERSLEMRRRRAKGRVIAPKANRTKTKTTCKN